MAASNGAGERSRIEGEIEVYLRRPELAPLEEIARYSADAEMVFLGLRALEAEETPETCSAYCHEILRYTAKFPSPKGRWPGGSSPSRPFLIERDGNRWTFNPIVLELR